MGELRDDDWDSRYFELINSLAVKNFLRYESQAEQLLIRKVLRIEVDGAVIDFRLTLLGCSFSTTKSNGSRSTDSWLRMGFSKSSKRKELPRYFAEAEACLLLDRKA